MSIKSTLIGGMLSVAVISTALLGILGTINISQNVIHEAQERVNHDLNTSFILYQQFQKTLADQLSYRIETIAFDNLTALVKK